MILIACKLQKRSSAPSQIGKRPLLGDISNGIPSKRVALDPSVKPTALRPVRLKKLKETRSAEPTFSIQDRKAVALGTNGVKATQEVISEHVSCLIFFFSNSTQGIYTLNCAQSQEEMVRKLLSKPFKIPIPGYSLSGRSLGSRLAGPRAPLYDPNEPNALIVYTPPEMSEHERLKADA